MAVGLSRMFGISLPLNFNSPYKATNIADFWRRWHMTLSRLLRDYLYIPLGGNRYGRLASYRNLLVTMLIGGLWHGAGWTFVIWGGLHGAFLIIHRLWRRVVASGDQTDRAQAGLLGLAAARTVTFLAVVVGWVVFRSRDFHEARGMLAAMAGLSGVVLPATWASRLGPLAQLSSSAGVRVGNLVGLIDSHVVTWVAVCLAIVWWAPNTQEIMAGFELALPVYESEKLSPPPLAWRPTPFAAVIAAIAALVAVASINRTSPFLYFQF
jgi:D-alanyl-lipoteichoic acid acyltransferase DltB (MBOAT superfamily)